MKKKRQMKEKEKWRSNQQNKNIILPRENSKEEIKWKRNMSNVKKIEKAEGAQDWGFSWWIESHKRP